jgi:hypothetical protein
MIVCLLNRLYHPGDLMPDLDVYALQRLARTAADLGTTISAAAQRSHCFADQPCVGRRSAAQTDRELAEAVGDWNLPAKPISIRRSRRSSARERSSRQEFDLL